MVNHGLLASGSTCKSAPEKHRTCGSPWMVHVRLPLGSTDGLSVLGAVVEGLALGLALLDGLSALGAAVEGRALGLALLDGLSALGAAAEGLALGLALLALHARVTSCPNGTSQLALSAGGASALQSKPGATAMISLRVLLQPSYLVRLARRVPVGPHPAHAKNSADDSSSAQPCHGTTSGISGQRLCVQPTSPTEMSAAPFILPLVSTTTRARSRLWV
jgi:hypothetical protein